MATLRAIAETASPGSELVFTYVDQVAFSAGEPDLRSGANAKAAAALGEPYLSGFDPKEIANELNILGLELMEDLDGVGMSERYGRTGPNALQPAASLHVALVRVRSS